ncbi:DMT family transporter [Parahaliea mediterranea]|uniref:DMT family transporter n=1 Tax=Parahaliea mediterranea TaxID=651086 RepID=A0A939IMT4_9GAMM|nr:DMT family transporter [Parahaliea mediterranea]MBN7797327.1 DMT family transporter [Parahaliea mediterranea]
MKAGLFMVGYGLFQTLVWLLVSYLGGSLPVTVMFLFRNLVGLAISLVRQPVSGFNLGTFRRWRMHLLRAAATLCGGLSIFYSVTRIPVADSVAITFLAPICGSLLGVFVLKEAITRHLLFKLVGGIGGVFIITGFGATGDTSGYLAALFGALMTGLAYVSVKRLADTETPSDILNVSYLLMVPCAAALAARDWVTPSATELLWLIALGAAFYLSQLLMASAFSRAPAAKILPLDYTRILFSSALGFLVLDQAITFHTWLGSILILAVTLIPERKSCGATA